MEDPKISADILSVSGADWATSLPGTNVRRYKSNSYTYSSLTLWQLMKLDARYTLKTKQGDLIYLRSKGIFNSKQAFTTNTEVPPADIPQDQAEWFTKLHFEAGEGPDEWMNSIFAIGVLAMHQGKIVIDAYSLTNLPGQHPTEGLIPPLC